MKKATAILAALATSFVLAVPAAAQEKFKDQSAPFFSAR